MLSEYFHQLSLRERNVYQQMYCQCTPSLRSQVVSFCRIDATVKVKADTITLSLLLVICVPLISSHFV